MHLKKIKLLFIAILFISLFLKLAPLANNNFPFTMDQARDMLDIRRMVVGLKPALVGPTTSINGVFLGPFWYYFNLPAFILSGGNPAALVYWQIIAYHLAAALLYLLTSKKNQVFGLIFSLLFLFTPTFFYATRYSWNANAMPIFTLVYLIALVETLIKPSKLKLFTLGLIAGFSFQIEAAFAILFFPFACIFLISKRVEPFWKSLAWLTFGFLITLVPQAIFELRHDFLSTRILLSEFTGQSDILGQKLALSDRLADRVDSYQGLLYGSLRLPQIYTKVLFVISTITSTFLLFTKKISPRQKLYTITSLAFLILSFSFYMLYPNKLKGWFITSLPIFYLVPIAVLFSFFIKQKNLFIKTCFSLILFSIVFFQLKVEYDHLPRPDQERSTDRSQLKNELAVIDWVYQEADGRAFQAYNYLPSIYDFPYQYLYWWYGNKTYGYQPDTVSYAQGIPEYIVDNHLFWKNKKQVDSDNYPIFLIMEHDLENKQRQQNWLANFSHLCFDKAQTFSWTSHAELYYPCKINP